MSFKNDPKRIGDKILDSARALTSQPQPAASINASVQLVKRSIPAKALKEIDADKEKAAILMNSFVDFKQRNALVEYLCVRATFDVADESGLSGYLWTHAGKLTCSQLELYSLMGISDSDFSMTVWAASNLVEVANGLKDPSAQAFGHLYAGHALHKLGETTRATLQLLQAEAVMPSAEAQLANSQKRLGNLQKWHLIGRNILSSQ